MKKKKNNVKNINYVTIMSIVIVILVFILSIGWASFNTSFYVDSSVLVRIKSDIRVTGFSYQSGTNGVISSGEEYNVKYVSGTVTLPNANSTVTYKIEVTNMELASNVHMGINSLTGLSNRLKITNISGYTLKDKICDDIDPTDCGSGSKKTFYITIGYNENGYDSNNKIYNFGINFEFKKVHDITYTGFTNPPVTPLTAIDGDTPTINLSLEQPTNINVLSGGTTLVENTNYTYSNYILTFITPIRENIFIINPSIFTITYELNGGTQATNQVTTYSINNNESIKNPTKTKNIFLGWYLESDFSGTVINSTSQLNGNVVLYAKWVADPYEIAATYITSLVGDASPNSTNIITLTSLDNTCTNTLAYDNTNEKNLRYVGSNPCNYVNFNCNGTTCELWRIIGVINGIDTNPVIKLVRNDFVSTAAAWDTASKNTWGTASLNTTLNSTYLNSLNNGVISNYVLNAAWNIGGVTSTSASQAAYNEEKATKSSNAYIGLISPSDYGYATSGTSDSTRSTCLTTGLSNTSATCYNNNFLFRTNHQWTINKRINGNNQVIRITDVGKTTNTKSDGSYYYRPVLYLKSNVKIDTSGGDGRPAHPFDLHVDS